MDDANVFDHIAGDYREKAKIQMQAALKLMDWLRIGSRDNVLDVGCGPGHLTYALKKSTRGQVLGVDISEKMIEKARQLYPDMEFKAMAAEDLNFREWFHVIFCNSTMQWFRQPEKALQAFYAALKPGGKLGLAAPATGRYSSLWVDLAAEVGNRPEFKAVFAHWHSPWFVLPDEDAYQTFFEDAGFSTERLEILGESADYSLDEAYGNYLSGPANGYTGRGFYDTDISDAYIENFNRAIRQGLEARAVAGRVKVDFQRLYYLGVKPAAG